MSARGKTKQGKSSGSGSKGGSKRASGAAATRGSKQASGKSSKGGPKRGGSKLESCFEVGRSPIHGRGIFASQRIRTGVYIGTFEGDRTRRNGPHVLWVIDEDGSEYGVKGRNSLRYLNHTSKPNAEWDGLDLIAIRNIESSAEITIHYGEEWNDVS
jgi:hypothetical protein